MEPISIVFNKDCFSEEAVKRACMELSDAYDFTISSTETEIVVASAQIPGGLHEEPEKILRFCVLDHQVRIDTENRFRTVRELIVAQAFAPCDNLQEMIEKTDI